MLVQFSFENFKSYKDETTLDFHAENINENNETLIKDKMDGEEFLPVIAIYGPNGGGKSNVLDAIWFLRRLISYNIPHFQREKNKNVDKDNEIMRRDIGGVYRLYSKDKYFRLDEKSKDKPIKFDIVFRTKGKEYEYQISILHNKIIEENLYMKKIEGEYITVFQRNDKEYYFNDIIKDISVENLKDSVSFLSYISSVYKIDDVSDAFSFLRYDIKYINYNSFLLDLDMDVIISKSNEVKNKVIKMLNDMDINIKDIRIVRDVNGRISEVFTVYGNKKKYELPFYEESAGTKKIFGFLAITISALEKGNIIVADELDSKLHPKLLRYIIELFTCQKINKKGAQLLLTSHDMTTMTKEVFRRDEIWFAALNKKHASKLYSLVEFKKENGQKVRNDEVYGKRYMEGRYGADPYLKCMLDWKS